MRSAIYVGNTSWNCEKICWWSASVFQIAKWILLFALLNRLNRTANRQSRKNCNARRSVAVNV